MYLDDIATRIRSQIPLDDLPDGDLQELFRLYALLLRVKGTDTTQSDVHDAWVAWMTEKNPDHESFVPYDYLDEETQEQDRVFAEAIKKSAHQLAEERPSQSEFLRKLFPSGPPTTEEAIRQSFELYKMMVSSSEQLVGRRQSVNTFFLTINSALLTASGLIVQSSTEPRLGGLGILVLAVVGAVLCLSWRSLIKSFGQLNTGKFKVINTLEKYLRAAIYEAEWEALGRGENPKIYRSFTSREIWVPNALFVIHLLTAFGVILVLAEVIEL